LGLSAAGALAGAGVSLLGAQKKNQAIKRAKSAQEASARVASTQNAARADAQKTEIIRRQERVRGAVAAAAGETGFSVDDFGSQLDQVEIDAGTNLTNVQSSSILDQLRLDSELRSVIVGLNNQREDLFTSGLSGGIQGGLAGLQLGEGIGAFQDAEEQRKKAAAIRLGSDQ